MKIIHFAISMRRILLRLVSLLYAFSCAACDCPSCLDKTPFGPSVPAVAVPSGSTLLKDNSLVTDEELLGQKKPDENKDNMVYNEDLPLKTAEGNSDCLQMMDDAEPARTISTGFVFFFFWSGP